MDTRTHSTRHVGCSEGYLYAGCRMEATRKCGGQFVGPQTHQEYAIAQCRSHELVLHFADYARAVMFALEDSQAGSTFHVVAEPRRQRQYSEGLANTYVRRFRVAICRGLGRLHRAVATAPRNRARLGVRLAISIQALLDDIAKKFVRNAYLETRTSRVFFALSPAGVKFLAASCWRIFRASSLPSRQDFEESGLASMRSRGQLVEARVFGRSRFFVRRLQIVS